MIKAILLIIVAIVSALVDWFKGKPNNNEPQWPRWVKLFCALIVCLLGIITLFEGYFAGIAGIHEYYSFKPDLKRAESLLLTAYNSPYKNRRVFDVLGLIYKNLADQASEKPVARHLYDKALNMFFESKSNYPKEVFALNNMINIYRRLCNWDQVQPLVESCEASLRIEDGLQNEGKPLSSENRSKILVTIGNVYADDMNMKHNPSVAVNYYRKAIIMNPKNTEAKLNLSAQLIILYESSTNKSDRINFLQEAYDIASNWNNYKEANKQIFSLINVIDALTEPDSKDLKIKDISLDDAINKILLLKDSWQQSDYEMWIVLAKASILNKKCDKTEEYLNFALQYVGRFTTNQRKTVQKLQKELNKIKINQFCL